MTSKLGTTSLPKTLMRYPTTEPGLKTHYIHYPRRLGGRCMCCKRPLEDAYATAGHRYHDFKREVNEVRYLRKCTNPACPLHGVPFNPTPSEVLPFKQFSLAVWKWVAQEAKLYNQNAEQICDRARRQFGLEISPNTIRNYIDEIDVLLGNQIDDKTRRLLQVQGIIVLALDGQKPDEGEKSLWIFVDLISNRVLKVASLESADSGTLHALVEEILARYQVKLVGLVSDKQNNLTKLHDDYYPAMPHQYCHFHFLQNTWNHVEVKDCGLHQQLSQGVKRLDLVKAPKQAKIEVAGRGQLPIRDVFKRVEKELRGLVKARNKKFKVLRGIASYEAVTAYSGKLDAALATSGGEGKGFDLLQATAASLRSLLEAARPVYADCKALAATFQEIRRWLGANNPSKGSLLAKGDRIFRGIWRGAREKGMARMDLRTFLPHKDTPRAAIEREMVRLYDSYRGGLFAYFDFPAPVKTNARIEQAIGVEKGRLRHRGSKACVGAQVRVRGEFELKQIYAGEDEVRDIIDHMGPRYSPADLKAGLQQLAARRGAETEGWRTDEERGGLEEVLKFLKESGNDKAVNPKGNKRD